MEYQYDVRKLILTSTLITSILFISSVLYENHRWGSKYVYVASLQYFPHWFFSCIKEKKLRCVFFSTKGCKFSHLHFQLIHINFIFASTVAADETSALIFASSLWMLLIFASAPCRGGCPDYQVSNNNNIMMALISINAVFWLINQSIYVPLFAPSSVKNIL